MATSRAVLVSVWLAEVGEADHLASLAEMERLAHTLGIEVVARVVQRRPTLAAAAVLGGGKLREVARLTGGSGVVPSGAERRITRAAARRQAAAEAEADEPVDDDLDAADGDDGDEKAGSEAGEGEVDGGTAPVADEVLVDNEISPSQIRNLERALDVPVIDRAGVIIEIFHRHARTREARLQVELARLAYEAPRLRERPRRGDRMRAGGVGGAGESDLELDRRRIRDRMAALRAELATLGAGESARRSRRAEESKVALVGYTNAGKSSLMRALTGSGALVADQLFATLGTTVRALRGGGGPRILVSDTVGFIKNLPHDLVASFRSTLEEAMEASLLLFVVDAADPDFRGQLAVTTDVLAEIGAGDAPRRIILNKSDRLGEAARDACRRAFPDATLMSTTSEADVAALASALHRHFQADWLPATLHVPYRAQRLVEVAHQTTWVTAESYDADGAILEVRGPPQAIERLRRALAPATS